MAQPLFFLNEPQTITQWKGVGHEPISAAECLFIDDLTGDIIVTSLVGANPAKNRVSYSQARFYAGEGAGSQYSGESAASSSVQTTPSRQITSVTIGCKNGPSRPIITARRFPRPIMIKSAAVQAAGGLSVRQSSSQPPSNGVATYEPAYLIAVSNDTRMIRFYTSAPSDATTNGSAPDGEANLHFTIGLGSYICCPNTIRFRQDFYNIRHFYWASNSIRQEQAKSPVSGQNGTTAAQPTDHQQAMAALNGAIDPSENASRSFYIRSKMLLGGGGMMVPAPPESADAAIKRAIGSVFSSGGAAGGGATPTTPTQASPSAFSDIFDRPSGVTVSSQVAKLHSSLLRDHLMVVFTEISIDLILVDFKASAGSGSGGSGNNADKGKEKESKDGQISRSGCEGMLVVMRRIATRVDYWHSVPSLHTSVVINSLKPTNVKPIAELGGHTWIMPQFRIAGLQAVPSTGGGTPSYLSDMQAPSVAPPQHFPSSSKATNTGAAASSFYPIQVVSLYGELYMAFTDYSRGCIVLYRYVHNNSNGQVVDLNAAMLKAAEKLQNSNAAAATSTGLGGSSRNNADYNPNAAFEPANNLSTVASLRYYSTSANLSALAAASDGLSFASSPTNVALVNQNNSGLSNGGVGAGEDLPKLTAYAMDPYKRATSVAQVAALVSEGQPMPLMSVSAQSPTQWGSFGASPILAAGTGRSPNASLTVDFAGRNRQHGSMTSVPTPRGSHVDPNTADSDLYLPLSDAVSNAVTALERQPSGSNNNAVGNQAPGTVQSTVFTGTTNGDVTQNNASFSFAQNGSLVRTCSAAGENSPSALSGCSTFEVAFVLPLPAMAVLSALRSEWYFGADVEQSFRWFSTPNPRESMSAARLASAQAQGSRQSGKASASEASTDLGDPLCLRAPVVLQASADDLLYVHFPDSHPPHYADTPRGSCHLIAAYDVKLAVVEGVLGGGNDSGPQQGQRSIHNSNLHGDPQTVEVATQRVADAFESLSASIRTSAANNAQMSRTPSTVPSAAASPAPSTAVSPQPSPSPRRGGEPDQAKGAKIGTLSHSSLHGVSAFRTLAAVSSYFTSAGSREAVEEANLSPSELLLFRKQQWIRHVTQMRVSELSSERFVDLGDSSDGRSALYSSDVLWREALQYLCARPSPDAQLRRAASAGGGLTAVANAGSPHPSLLVQPSSSRLTATKKDSEKEKGSWIRSIFGRGEGSGKNGSSEETDFFAYAPVVHHLPLDALTSPFEGAIRVCTGSSSPIVALEPPSSHQPFVVSTVRHNALALLSRFDCYCEEVWGIVGHRLQVTGCPAGGLTPHSPSRQASPAFGFKVDYGGGVESPGAQVAPYSVGGVQLHRPHFGPGGHYQRSLCFAAQFILHRRAHFPRLPATLETSTEKKGQVSVPGPAVVPVMDSVTIVKNVLLRSIAALESQAAIGRLIDVVVAHQCQNGEGSAWHRYWRSRWSQIGAATSSGEVGGIVSPLKSPVDVPSSSILPLADAPARLVISAGAALDPRGVELIRYLRSLSQPHLWPVNAVRIAPSDAIVSSMAIVQQGGGEAPASPGPMEVILLPLALDSTAVYEDIVCPLLQQLSSLSSTVNTPTDPTGPCGNGGIAAEIAASQAVQAGYPFFKAYVQHTLFEYCRSVVQHGLSITVPIQSSLLDLLLRSAHHQPIGKASPGASLSSTSVVPKGALQSFGGSGLGVDNLISPRDGTPSCTPGGNEFSGESQSAYFRLHQLLMYRSLEDHVPTAMQLIALQSAYPPAFQMGLDILGRLEAHSHIVQVFVTRKMPLRAAKYLLSVRGLGGRSGAVSAVGVGTLPSNEDLSCIVAILESASMLHDEERKSILDPHVPINLPKPAKAEEDVAADGTDDGGETKEPTPEEESRQRMIAVVSYLDHRLAKKKLKYQNELTTGGAVFCNVYTMMVQQWVETALRTAIQQERGSSNNTSLMARVTNRSSPPTAPNVGAQYPMLMPYIDRFERIKAGKLM